MATMWRVVTDWSGGKIGTGFTNHYFSGGVSTPQACVDSVKAFWQAATSIGAYLPTGIVLSFRANVDAVEATDGGLVTQLAVTAPGAVNGSDNGRYAALAGSCITWRTGDFFNGRRIRGRTFIVPLGGGALQADGTIDTGPLGAINAAAATFIAAAPELLVWHRPSAPHATDGTQHTVLSGTAADRACYLTSRR